MSDQPPQQQDGSSQAQQNVQPSSNPLLNRPPNPNLDVMVQKGNERLIERNTQNDQRIIEQKREEGKD